MKKKHTVLLFLVFTLTLLNVSININTKTVFAKESNYTILVDDADLLTPEEEEKVSAQLTDLGKKQRLTAVVLTMNSAGSQDLSNYVENYCEEHNYPKHCVFLAVNMDPANREVLVHGYGKCKLYVNSKRAQQITDGMVPDMSAGNYYDGILYYIDQVDYYMNHKAEVLIPRIALELLGSMLIASMFVLVLVLSSGGKNTTNCNTYLDSSSSRLLAKRDIYTHTTTTRHKKQSSSSSGKSGGGGGGGRSHSTGRSSF